MQRRTGWRVALAAALVALVVALVAGAGVSTALADEDDYIQEWDYGSVVAEDLEATLSIFDFHDDDDEHIEVVSFSSDESVLTVRFAETEEEIDTAELTLEMVADMLGDEEEASHYQACFVCVADDLAAGEYAVEVTCTDADGNEYLLLVCFELVACESHGESVVVDSFTFTAESDEAAAAHEHDAVWAELYCAECGLYVSAGDAEYSYSEALGFCVATYEVDGVTYVGYEEDDLTVWRLYNPYTGEHLYTMDENEYVTLVALGWTGEGVGWYADSCGVAVYRLYNPYTGDHHYTTDLNEYETLATLGWQQEGIAFASASDDADPVYRLYNPYAESFYHLFTTDENEYQTLVSLGWEGEGIGWYGWSAE